MDRATAITIVTNRLRPLLSAATRAVEYPPALLRQRARDLLIEILPYRHGFTSGELDELARECGIHVTGAATPANSDPGAA